MKKIFSVILLPLLALCLLNIGTVHAEAADDSILTFGHYSQTADGTDSTPIEWIVLDLREDKALVISRLGLDVTPYNNTRSRYANETWETCSLRTWLNEDFFAAAFTEEEQQLILLTSVDNGPGQLFDFTAVSSSTHKTKGGNDTEDRIFLLSSTEANDYFDVAYGETENSIARVQPTEYAIAKGAVASTNYVTVNGAPSGWWWLRSPGASQDRAACVFTDGSLDDRNIDWGNATVRPAMWISLDALSR